MVDPTNSVTQTPIRVFLVDDHEMVRRGLSEMIGAAGGMVVVGEAGTAEEALRRIPAVSPDVALLDVQLPDGSGVDVCREIRSSLPEVSCLFLTSYDDDEALFAAVMAGAAGYLLKQIRGINLIEGIRQVAQGQSLLDPAVTKKLLDRLRNPAGTDENPRARQLTHREREILYLIADGCTNKEIGQQLFLAEKTVKNYISAIFVKVGVVRRSQAAVFGSHLRDPAESA
jgi:two-component system response regulator DevR